MHFTELFMQFHGIFGTKYKQFRIPGGILMEGKRNSLIVYICVNV